MKKTKCHTVEPLLTQYFLIDSVLRGYVDEGERFEIFSELARVFCVPMDKAAREYYALSGKEPFSKITTYPEYERLCRAIEYAQSNGQDVGLTLMDRTILAQKREAMSIRNDIFGNVRNLTEDMIGETLLDRAGNGNVDAMALLAFMEYHGISVSRDRESAEKRMKLCAKWNSLFGNLMGVAYDEANRADYYDKLYTFLRSSSQREVFVSICEYGNYDGEAKRDPVARIIEKAMGLGVIKRNAYDSIFAKIAFSELISAEEKAKLLLNKKNEAIVSLSDIPFGAKRGRRPSFDRDALRGLPFERADDLEEMLCALSPIFMGDATLYRPLLVACEDDYVSEAYANALKEGFGSDSRIVEVDASAFSPADFSGTKENFLLRGLAQTKNSNTVFFIKHCDEMNEGATEQLIKYLDSGYLRSFKLQEPTVSLDISDVKLVLFASRRSANLGRLARECELVRAARISEAEKLAMIDARFEGRALPDGRELRMSEECKALLAPMSVENVIRLVDCAVKKAVYEDAALITPEMLKAVIAQQNSVSGKREFGYLGGIKNEKH